MANVAIDATVSSEIARAVKAVASHRTDQATLYAVFIDADFDLYYNKSGDKGATWGTAAGVATTVTVSYYSIWADWWTPGDTGTKIHIAWNEGAVIKYRNLDTATDTLSTTVTVFTGVSNVNALGTLVDICKTVGGNIHVHGTIDNNDELFHYRSTDGGATFGSVAHGYSATPATDWMHIYPAANTGDSNDLIGVYFDASANTLEVKLYDQSGDAWTGTTALGAAGDFVETTQYLMAASIRHSDGHLIVVGLTAFDAVTTDRRVFDVNHNGTAFANSELTAITTNVDDTYFGQVFIDQNTDDIYVLYNGKSDGTESVNVTTSVYYVKSTDGGTTWTGIDTAYSEGAAAQYQQIFAPLSGSVFYGCWRRASTIFEGNAVSSLTFAAGVTFEPAWARGSNVLIGVPA